MCRQPTAPERAILGDQDHQRHLRTLSNEFHCCCVYDIYGLQSAVVHCVVPWTVHVAFRLGKLYDQTTNQVAGNDYRHYLYLRLHLSNSTGPVFGHPEQV